MLIYDIANVANKVIQSIGISLFFCRDFPIFGGYSYRNLDGIIMFVKYEVLDLCKDFYWNKFLDVCSLFELYFVRMVVFWKKISLGNVFWRVFIPHKCGANGTQVWSVSRSSVE